MTSIFDRSLIYVTGKGGVGRSTVAGALGLAAADRGRRTIVCEVAEQGRLPGVFGRELKVVSQDDQFDCGINKALAEDDVTKYFTLVGSFSLFDGCGAVPLKAHPEMPDIHVPLDATAQALPNNFAVQPVKAGASTGPFQYIKEKHPNAITKVGSLIGNVDTAKATSRMSPPLVRFSARTSAIVPSVGRTSIGPL